MRKIEPKIEQCGLDRSCNKEKDGPKKIYPHLRLEHQLFPETKKWKVGKEYKIEMMVKMTGLSIARFQNDSEFDIVGFDSEDTLEDKKEK